MHHVKAAPERYRISQRVVALNATIEVGHHP
jgi:hypothetical protein